MENFPIFPIQKVPGNVLKTLLWGPETIRKKYWVVFEIFLKTMFFRLFQKIKFEIFLLEKFPIFPIRKVPEDVFRSLLWGPKAIRKKYRVLFEIFPKSWFFCPQNASKFGKKASYSKFFYWKNFWFFQFGNFQKMFSNLFCGDQKQSRKNIK